MERDDSCLVANLVAPEGNPGEVTLTTVARFFDDRERSETGLVQGGAGGAALRHGVADG